MNTPIKPCFAGCQEACFIGQANEEWNDADKKKLLISEDLRNQRQKILISLLCSFLWCQDYNLKFTMISVNYRIFCIPSFKKSMYRQWYQVLTETVRGQTPDAKIIDNAKFCSNSRGSCWETLDHLITANDEGLISEDMYKKGRTLSHEAIKLINGYMNYLYKAGKNKTSAVKEELSEYGESSYQLSVDSFHDPDIR